MDIPLPRLRFSEPASGKPGLDGIPQAEPAALSPPRRPSIISARARSGRVVEQASGTRAPFAPSTAAWVGGDRRRSRVSSGGEGGGRAFDSPRFAATLKRLVAVKTRLWNRWDLSTFAALTSLEVSFAGRAMLKQLHRKVGGGGRGDRSMFLSSFGVCYDWQRVSPVEMESACFLRTLESVAMLECSVMVTAFICTSACSYGENSVLASLSRRGGVLRAGNSAGVVLCIIENSRFSTLWTLILVVTRLES